MTSNLCRILSHRRDKKRVRPYLETWRSECARCGVPMVRNARGVWTSAPALRTLLRPAADASHTLLARVPAANERQMPDKRVVAGPVGAVDLACANDLSAALPASRPAALGARELYLARSAECRRMAAAAADRSIELIHLDLATRYDLLARDAKGESRHLHAVR